MFYEDPTQSGLPHDPFKAIVAPRPIGWIGTLNRDGVPNLGPYSFFNAISAKPNIVMFSSEGWKHSPANARDSGEFTFSLATHALRHQMNVSSAHLDDGVSEFEKAGLEMGVPRVVSAPFVKASPAALECRVLSCTELTDLDGKPTDRIIVVGQVVGTHIDDAYIVDGRFSGDRAQAIARCGYKEYATAAELWELERPDMTAIPA